MKRWGACSREKSKRGIEMPQEKKERWGAFIKGTEVGTGDRIRQIKYDVSVGRFEKPLAKGEMFTTNNQISERIKEASERWKQPLKKASIGHISYVIETDGKRIRTGCYFPVPPDLRGMRLSPRVELMCTKDLQKRFPGYLILPRAISAKKPRKRQPKRANTKAAQRSQQFVTTQQLIQSLARYVGGFKRRKPR